MWPIRTFLLAVWIAVCPSTGLNAHTSGQVRSVRSLRWSRLHTIVVGQLHGLCQFRFSNFRRMSSCEESISCFENLWLAKTIGKWIISDIRRLLTAFVMTISWRRPVVGVGVGPGRFKSFIVHVQHGIRFSSVLFKCLDWNHCSLYVQRHRLIAKTKKNKFYRVITWFGEMIDTWACVREFVRQLPAKKAVNR